jgi:acyl carrier protein
VWTADFEDILRRHLALPGDTELTADADLADLGLDSMGTVTLLVDLESELGVTFPDESLVAETFATPGALWTLVSSLTGQRL